MQLLQIFPDLHVLAGIFFGLRPHGFFRKEKTVKDPVENQLLIPGLGIDGAQRRFYLLAVFKTQQSQHPGGISGFLGTDGKTLQLQHSGKSG